MRDRRPLNPSSRLTSAFNAAEPVLSSHRESVAQAQRARAVEEARNALLATIPTSNVRSSLPTLTIIPPCIDSDADNTHSIPRLLVE